MKMERRVYFGILFFLVFLVSLGGCSSKSNDPLDINLREHADVALHIHAQLDLEVNGVQHHIPANVGISSTGMRIIHTHDDTGKLHIEAPRSMPVYLGYFFEIWGKEFNNKCVLDFCSEEDNLKMYVNGNVNHDFENYLIKDNDLILITNDKSR
jgi:hypothetical protein